jgi:hypothetical protein
LVAAGRAGAHDLPQKSSQPRQSTATCAYLASFRHISQSLLPYRPLLAGTPHEILSARTRRLRVGNPRFLEPNPARSGIKNVEPNSPARVIFRTRPSRET